MITMVGNVSIFVNDQQRARDFYVNKLGFELKRDAEFFPGSPNRWISVVPRDGQTEVVLYLPDEAWLHYQQVVGKSQAVTFMVDDVEATVADLRAKGVEISVEPNTLPWGKNAAILDSEGNWLLLVELPGQG